MNPVAMRSILCPVDFSDPSRSALMYAAAVASHFDAELTVLAVDDPLLAEAAADAGLVPSLADETREELQRVCAEVLGAPAGPGAKTPQLRVRTGKPAVEILHEARERAADLIVMSSRGHTGVRKVFFGSTTERVLRETSVPVLITPSDQPPAHWRTDTAGYVGRVLVPVDLTGTSHHQVSIAGAVAQGLSVPLMLLHVLERVVIPMRVRMALSGADATRRSEAEEQLLALSRAVPEAVNVETLVLMGDVAEETVKLAEARRANLIVMALQSSELFGPRIGSVTYRVVALARTLVLALPAQAQS
jgi:nucleotide-binding universal stress UspA family protein